MVIDAGLRSLKNILALLLKTRILLEPFSNEVKKTVRVFMMSFNVTSNFSK